MHKNSKTRVKTRPTKIYRVDLNIKAYNELNYKSNSSNELESLQRLTFADDTPILMCF